MYGQPGDPNAQYGQPGMQPQYGAPGAPATPGAPAPMPTPAAAPAPAPAAAPAAAPAGADAATAAAVRLALTPRAANEAKGMKEDGPAIGGMLNEGAELTQEFMLMPGKCYTILGQGLPPIAELDMTLSLKLPVPGLPAVLAADQTTGAAASIGSGKNCYKYPFPIAAQVVLSVKATKGSGPAGAQVYSK
jgi:hypothetical protein